MDIPEVKPTTYKVKLDLDYTVKFERYCNRMQHKPEDIIRKLLTQWLDGI